MKFKLVATCQYLFTYLFTTNTYVFVIIELEIAVSASSSDVFTSPEVAKSFDFTNEERIYNW